MTIGLISICAGAANRRLPPLPVKHRFVSGVETAWTAKGHAPALPNASVIKSHCQTFHTGEQS